MLHKKRPEQQYYQYLANERKVRNQHKENNVAQYILHRLRKPNKNLELPWSAESNKTPNIPQNERIAHTMRSLDKPFMKLILCAHFSPTPVSLIFIFRNLKLGNECLTN